MYVWITRKLHYASTWRDYLSLGKKQPWWTEGFTHSENWKCGFILLAPQFNSLAHELFVILKDAFFADEWFIILQDAGCRISAAVLRHRWAKARHGEQAAVFLHGNYSNIIKFQEWTRQDWPRTVVSIEYWSYKTCARKTPTSCYMFNWNYAFTHRVLFTKWLVRNAKTFLQLFFSIARMLKIT